MAGPTQRTLPSRFARRIGWTAVLKNSKSSPAGCWSGGGFLGPQRSSGRVESQAATSDSNRATGIDAPPPLVNRLVCLDREYRDRAQRNQ